MKAEIKESCQSSKSFNEQKYAELQSEIDTLNTNIREGNAKSNDAIQHMNDIDKKISRLARSIQTLNTRLTKLEKKLGNPKKPQATQTPIPLQNDVTGATSSMEYLYNDAYQSFIRGKYPAARKKFTLFLKKYPHTAYSDNARFWIGETYYAEGDFERAILEYEKVRRKYPHGDKVPSSLLKEGMAFIKLNDKTDGKILLKKLVKKYPHTDQAKIAHRILRRMR